MHAPQHAWLAIGSSIVFASGVAVAATDPANLVGSHWQLVQFQSNDDSQAPVRFRGVGLYTLSLLSRGRALFQFDCNQGQASWSALSSPDGLRGSFVFGPLAQTRMRCPDNSLEPVLSAKLPLVRSYRLEGPNLYLALMADGGILSWRRLDGAEGPEHWRVRQHDQPLLLSNLGCSSTAESWCLVQLPGDGVRGSVPLPALESELSVLLR